MSAGAYALLRFADTEKLLPAVDRLRAAEGVRQWHAVEGHYHLVVAVDEATAALEQEIASLDGLEFHRMCRIEQSDGVFEIDPERAAAYVFVEIDGQADAAVAALRSADIAFASLAVTDCGIVGILQRSSFEEVDRTVDAALRTLDGVLRVKRDWIIDLTQL